MSIRHVALAAVILLGGCEEEEAASDPAPVAPLEVSAPDGTGAEPQPSPDVAALQERVAELEAQLAARDDADAVEPTTPESAGIRSGMDTPQRSAPREDEAEEDAEDDEEQSVGSRRRRDRDRDLLNPLDVLLGP